MDEFEGTCPACQRVWNLRAMIGSDPVIGNAFVMFCPYCQVTAPRNMKYIVMKKIVLEQSQDDTITTERIS